MRIQLVKERKPPVMTQALDSDSLVSLIREIRKYES
jgi:hypothetical protein